MPNNNNRIQKQDLLDALNPAELKIARFQPPSATPSPSPDPTTLPPPPNLEQIQLEVSQKSAAERTDALFDFLTRFITEKCQDEIDRQRIVAALQGLRTDITRIQEILTRNQLA